MITDSVVGRRSPSFRLVVEEGKVREFARAVRSESAEHFRRDAPVSPVTFLAVANHWQPEEEDLLSTVGLDMTRVLHGSQEFILHGPPPVAGTELVGQQRIDADFRKMGRRGGRMRFIDLVTEYRDDVGALVAEVRTQVIETSEAVRS